MARPDRAAGVKSLADSARDTVAVILTEYYGLSVRQMKELRLALGGKTHHAVAKNKFSKFAFKEVEMEGLDEYLVDPTAITFAGHDGDPVAVAKAISKPARENPAPVIKGGLMDGNVMDAEDVKKLASLKSHEVLLAKSVGILKAFMYRAVAVMVALVSKTVHTVDTPHEEQAKAA